MVLCYLPVMHLTHRVAGANTDAVSSARTQLIVIHVEE